MLRPPIAVASGTTPEFQRSAATESGTTPEFQRSAATEDFVKYCTCCVVVLMALRRRCMRVIV